jgi:hypothetical protein
VDGKSRRFPNQRLRTLHGANAPEVIGRLIHPNKHEVFGGAETAEVLKIVCLGDF